MELINEKDLQEQFPNLFLNRNVIQGEINICAVYDGKHLLHFPDENTKKKYFNTFVRDCYEIKICLNTLYSNNTLPKVYEVGNRIPSNIDFHIYTQDNSCCLGLFKNAKPTTIEEFVKNYVIPFFTGQAYVAEYGRKPPWKEYSHGQAGIDEFEKDKKNIGRNDSCCCGSGKKYKECCIK